jgi:hypothetical protein
MPAPADVQTTNGGATVGKAEAGDTVVFTFAGAVVPDLVIAGWDGSPTSVTVTISHLAGSNDALTVADSGGTLAALGSVDLGGNYANTVDFTGSTMTASGNTITVVLGTPGSGNRHTVGSPTTMTWTCPTGTATESGAPDPEF